ncbi:ATP-binding protein [Anoxybacteroides amylolyticum]|uniref:Histidine kinase-, DNA gyrase B-, and HSP90-like ATPase family protein n=1 Tax=Anoxybacteroides amylolyticum TaxID=294699 RepID=A0A160F2K0_9BACL|nr:ATP-binding protein [Anoxybacillus amylolyticus]ANB60467.1 histidine kinase-, DNA gyrase B-, and HSP90-like ATPase family protein [Anoxybacillus amylolyticus]
MYEMVLRCPANVETIELCDLIIDSLASFFVVRDRQALVLSVHEAIINAVEAVRTQFDNDDACHITVSVRITAEEVTILVADAANGLSKQHIESRQEKRLEDVLLEESGRGLLLMRELMDDLWAEPLENGAYAIGMKMRR